jgi:ATP adenylyltransferase
MEYILSAKKHGSCLFCEISKGNKAEDKQNFVLYKSKHCFALMNRYPYNNGHIMVVPHFHTPTFDGLSDKILFDFIKTVDKSVTALKNGLGPDGFNIGLNFGKVAGAGMEEHMHLHIVPRWLGDTDGMPILSETRVMPEHLKKTYNKIHKVF